MNSEGNSIVPHSINDTDIALARGHGGNACRSRQKLLHWLREAWNRLKSFSSLSFSLKAADMARRHNDPWRRMSPLSGEICRSKADRATLGSRARLQTWRCNLWGTTSREPLRCTGPGRQSSHHAGLRGKHFKVDILVSSHHWAQRHPGGRFPCVRPHIQQLTEAFTVYWLTWWVPHNNADTRSCARDVVLRWTITGTIWNLDTLFHFQVFKFLAVVFELKKTN